MKYLAPSLIPFISGALLVLSIMFFSSSILKLKTDLFLNDWKKSGAEPDLRALDTAIAYSLESREWFPVNDGFLNENIGKAYQWKTYNQNFDSDNQEIISARQKALTAYRSQTQLTPLWPMSWINLASIKIELKEFDDEFYSVYFKAKKMTEQIPSLQYRTTLLGIRSWHGIDNTTRNIVLADIIKMGSIGFNESAKLRKHLQKNNLLLVSCTYAKAKKTQTYGLCK
jgi:hypothetical protein